MACIAAPTVAQDDVVSGGEIVVEGETQEERDVRTLASRMTAEVGLDTPATRYFDALCLAVSGLNRAGNEYVANRIRANAQEIGLAVQDEGCRVNAQVLVHSDIPALYQRIKEDHPEMMTQDERVKVEAAVARGDDIVVWHNQEDRNTGGRRIGYSQTVPGMVGSTTGLNVVARINDIKWPSRAELSSSRGVVSAAVLFDSDIVEGMEIDRLSDYATLRLLAPNLLPHEAARPDAPESIASLFPEEGGAEGLTRFDRAYLTALYELRPNAPSTRLAAAVAREYFGEN
ncbi:hypothetical protein [Aurantiacibacter hainanensis]|uniref:hypothetical protein n=1 Tax=Aurantiacibacter hainanensis TaxID=3076114 RepID=UPI0030C77EF1